MARVDVGGTVRRVLVTAAALACAASVLAACAPEHPTVATPPASHLGRAAVVVTPSPTPTPVDPLSITCPTRTTMSVWAHMDDDLLFLQSPIAHDIAAGRCVRTVFVTAADDGRGSGYAAGRETGIERAYDRMRGRATPWQTDEVVLGTGVRVLVAQPVDDPRITIVFFRLPDGNLSGRGFPRTGMVSLEMLLRGRIPHLEEITGTGAVTRDSLVASLVELTRDFSPERLLTTVPRSAGAATRGDHPDHSAVGELATVAWHDAGGAPTAVTYALGYQTMYLPANVAGEALRAKEGVFQDYAAHDPRIDGCVSFERCLLVRHYGLWLQREYTLTAGQFAAYRAPIMPEYPLATPGPGSPPAPHR